MSFFNSVMSMGKAALQRMSAPPDPNLVKAVGPAEFVSVPVVGREGCMVLYGPRTVGKGEHRREVYEVVAQSEKQSYRYVQSMVILI